MHSENLEKSRGVREKDESPHWMLVTFRSSYDTFLKRVWFFHGSRCMASRTLPEITVSENRSLCHPQMQVKALSSSRLLWGKDHLKQTEAKWKMWHFKFFLENMDTTSFRIKSIQLVISTQSKMLNHILHLWQQQRLCGERVGTEMSCLHTTSFLALKKCGQCVAVEAWFKPLGF